jgi:hypothetical protein
MTGGTTTLTTIEGAIPPVTMAAIPELGTWVMLLIGFALFAALRLSQFRIPN